MCLCVKLNSLGRMVCLAAVLPITLASASTLAEDASDGAAASNPTAAVNFQDVRYRYFDLDGGAETHSFETEGSYVFNPFGIKAMYEELEGK